MIESQVDNFKDIAAGVISKIETQFKIKILEQDRLSFFVLHTILLQSNATKFQNVIDLTKNHKNGSTFDEAITRISHQEGNYQNLVEITKKYTAPLLQAIVNPENLEINSAQKRVDIIMLMHANKWLDNDNLYDALTMVCLSNTERNIPILLGLIIFIKKLGLSISQQNKSGQTALHCACSANNLEKAKFLLASGADVNALDKKDMTPLHIATMLPSQQIVELLIAKGADINHNSSFCATPLMLACYKQLLGLVTYLIGNKADTNIAHKETGDTALHIVCNIDPINNNLTTLMVTALLRFGANVNARNNVGRTPLHMAACHANNAAIAETLIENGANIYEVDINGMMPLFMMNNKMLCEMILKSGQESSRLIQESYGVALPEKDKMKFFMAHSVCLSGSLLLFQLELQQAGQYHSLREMLKCYPLPLLRTIVIPPTPELAANQSDRVAIIKLIFTNGLIDQDSFQENLYSIINDLCARDEERDIPALQEFIRHVTDINKQDKHGIPLLHAACALGDNIAKIKLLVEAGANVNSVDAGGNTPLHIASSKDKKPQVVEFLLNQGADAHILNKEQEMPIDYSIAANAKTNQGIFSAHLIAQDKRKLPDRFGWKQTYIYQLVVENNLKLLNLFLIKVDREFLNLKDCHGSALLHWLCTATLSSPGALGSLLEKEADIELRNAAGATPLHVACANNQYHTTEYLVAKGANVNSRTSRKNRDPSHIAAKYGSIDVIKYLLDKGLCDLNSQDKYLNTALDISYAHGHCDCAERLIREIVDTVNNSHTEAQADHHSRSVF